MKTTLTSAAVCLAMLALGLTPSAQAAAVEDTLTGLGSSPRPTSIWLDGSTGAVKAGTEVTLTGTVNDGRQRPDWRSHVVVTLSERAKSGWTPVEKQTVYTGFEVRSDFSFAVAVEHSSTFRASVRATQKTAGSVSERVQVKVAEVSIAASRARLAAGKEITVSADCDRVCAGKRVTLQKKVHGAWQYFAKTHMNDRGRHDFTWNTATVGTYRMRVVVGNRWVTSKTVTFDVAR